MEGIHSKNTFTVYGKKEKRIQVTMLPKTANKVKQLLTYNAKDRRNKSIFAKETVQCLGHLTSINPLRIDHVGCQELINDLLIGVAMAKAQNDANLFEKFNTTASYANYDMQV
eukprot:3643856-Ditylum_brightwellii.AAC.1